MTVAVVGALQLVTMAGPERPRVGPEMSELGLMPEGAMFVKDGRIESIGTTAEIQSLIEADTTVVEAAGGVVVPGFVDAHTHPVFGGDRLDEFEMRSRGAAYEEIARSGGGILSTVRKTRAASEDELLNGARRHAEWFLKGGTTTIEAKSGYGLDLATELKMLRVVRRLGEESVLGVSPTFLGAHAVPEEFRGRPTDYADLIIEEMIPAVVREGLAEWCDVFCESIAFDLETTRAVMTAAKDAGLKLRMHVDQLTRGGGAELAAELGAKTADHLEQTDAAGIQALAKAGVQPVLLPGSVFALGHTRYPQARAMIDAGLAVVLATDFNPGSSPSTSMPMAMSLACTHMRMSPAEALCAATINPAHSLDRGSEIGSLEPGKRADFAIWDVNDYREIAYYFAIPLRLSTFVSGEQVSYDQ